jgi:hypothetical protein
MLRVRTNVAVIRLGMRFYAWGQNWDLEMFGSSIWGWGWGGD